jgi:hypothetical protein
MTTTTTHPAHRPPATRLAAVMACVSLLVGGLTGCGNYAPEDQVFLSALPRLADVAFQPPGAELEEGEGGTAQPGQVQQALSTCDEAPLRCQTQETARTFNGLTAGLLQIVDGVLVLTNFKRYKDRRVWGPFHIPDTQQPSDLSKGLTVRFELERMTVGPDVEHPYRWCLHVATGKRDQWRLDDPLSCDVEVDPERELTKVLYGALTPGENTNALAGTGAGQLTLDGNLLATLAPDDESIPRARFDITYDHFGGSDLIDLNISEVVDESSGLFTSGAYHFSRLEDGSGDFYFTVKVNVNGNGPDLFEPEVELETFEILSQWNGEREGSARAAIYGGDLGELITGEEVRWDVTECWDANLDTVYLEHPDEDVTNVGAIGNCTVPIPNAL